MWSIYCKSSYRYFKYTELYIENSSKIEPSINFFGSKPKSIDGEIKIMTYKLIQPLMSNRIKILLALVVWSFWASAVNAAPLTCSPASTLTSGSATVYCGTDRNNNITTNSDTAFTAWSTSVGSFVLDNIDGATATTNQVTTSLGNTFTAGPDSSLGLVALGFNTNVLEGNHLRLGGTGNNKTFTWDLLTGIESFGFFGRSNGGSLITVAFAGGESVQEFLSGGSVNDNLFWGIESLSSPVTSVTISSTDSDSRWDRFVYIAAPAAVPVPGTMMLLALGLLAFMFVRSRYVS